MNTPLLSRHLLLLYKNISVCRDKGVTKDELIAAINSAIFATPRDLADLGAIIVSGSYLGPCWVDVVSNIYAQLERDGEKNQTGKRKRVEQ